MKRKPYSISRVTSFDGKSNVPIGEVAKELGISRSTAYKKCVVQGMTGDDILYGIGANNRQKRTTTFRGKSNVPLSAVAMALNIPYHRVWQRCAVGRSTGDDLERESDPKVPYGELIEINGEKHTRAEWQRILGINKMTVTSRLKRGWTIEEALTKPPKPTRVKKETTS